MSDGPRPDQPPITATTTPATVSTLVDDLRELGVKAGGLLLVHSSLSRLGYVAGGAYAVVEALVAAVGPNGTIMMPAFSGDLSDPSRWVAPPVPEAWWPVIRENMPVFDPAVTPTRHMGAIVECFLRFPNVVRSAHPRDSFAARGPVAAHLLDDHPIAYALGEHSPLARVYDLDGEVLLLGVDHGNNSSLHLAEYRADLPVTDWISEGAPVTVDGQRTWVTYPDRAGNSDDFPALGEAFAAARRERRGPVGAGLGRLMRQRDVVDFGVHWLETNRG
jgi:aminoglycoside 3-N-acetyltransferase